MHSISRRRVLGAVGAGVGMSALAGCTGGEADGGRFAEASFHVMGDLTTAIVGDVDTTATLVPIGQHGHGWEAGPAVQERVYDADVFVTVLGGFQPWADALAQNIAADGLPIAHIEAGHDVSLLTGGHDHGEDEHDHDEEHHGEDDHDHEEEHHGEDDHDHEEEHHGEDDHDHDHSGADPHFWMDPHRVETAAATISAGLQQADPDNADAYAANTDALIAELERLDGELQAVVDGAQQQTILVAGHDSFQYLGDRYGVRVEALTGIAPDAMPTPRDIERAQQVIATHGVSHICADPLEPQQAAEQLVAETDAVGVVELTAIPGLQQSWADAGWDYLDIMREVNIPALRTALDA
jgi:zinc transport system substrate-binding protein